jgi:hypothetical protein
MPSPLHTFERRLAPSERAEVFDGVAPLGAASKVVQREAGGTIDVTILDSLMAAFEQQVAAGRWADRTLADRWLAPRVHYSLRLTRATASDRGLWQWLALRHASHTTWRWTDEDGGVADERWFGPVNKQVFARLWWGAELFRDGADYGPVERAFIRQDLINSYLHRPLVRCRSLALGILDVVAPADDPMSRSADDVNALARVLNLATAGAPPELETDFQQDDWPAFAAWAAEEPDAPASWDDLPTGPKATDTTDWSRAGGRTVARRGWSYTGETE